MKTACLALLGSLLAVQAHLASAGIVVTLANDPGQNGGKGINNLQCNGGQLTTTVNLLASININNIHAYQPMAEIGLPTINMAFLVAGKPATVAVQNAFNVANSKAAGNVWTFTLQDDGPHPGGQLSLGACTQGAAIPAVTASFSTTSFINGQGLPNGADGGPAVPAVSGVPTLVNGLPAAFVAAAANNGNAAAAAASPSATPAAKAAGTTTTTTTTTAAGTPPNQDGNCVLTYPNTKDPILSAAGLATPWTITAGCDQTADTPTFIQGTVFDPATGNLFVYNPLVINVGTQPAIKPTAPKLPAGAIVTLHFGTNGGSTTLADASKGAMLAAAKCVNGGGADKSIFGQFAYCNAVAFFAAVNAAKTLNPPIPALGTDKTGMPCPTTRSFTIVDQDPSDNVITTYLLTSDNKLAQNTAANQAALKAAGKAINVLANGSDNRLVTVIDNIIGCKPYMAPDLADNNAMIASLALNEIMAANRQAAPVAKVPPNDPMVLLGNGNIDATGAKVVAYRQGVNENTGNAANLGTGTGYCKNLGNLAPPAYAAWAKAGLTTNAPPADPAVGTNMATFLGARFQAAWGLLNCQKLTGMPSPITCVDAQGKPAGDNPAAKCTTSNNIVIQSVDTSADADSQPGPIAASDQAATSGASLVPISIAAGLMISSLSVAASFV